jgi:hypothetical protein
MQSMYGSSTWGSRASSLEPSNLSSSLGQLPARRPISLRSNGSDDIDANESLNHGSIAEI